MPRSQPRRSATRRTTTPTPAAPRGRRAATAPATGFLRAMSSAARRMTTAVERVTPAMADAWLNQNYEGQRPLNAALAETYAEMMRQGRWQLTSQGIAFDENGKLIDGQHRLWAITWAGVPVEMVVARHVPTAAFQVMDQQKTRSIADLSSDKTVNMRLVAVARALARGPSSTPLFDPKDGQLMLAFLGKHRTTLDRAMALRPERMTVQGRKFLQAPVMGAVARATAYARDAQLRRFLEVLCSGVTADASEGVIILLRDYLRNSTARGGLAQTEHYQKTQRALKAYLRGEQLTQLKGAERDLFPLAA